MTASDRASLTGQAILSRRDAFAFFLVWLPRAVLGMFVLATMVFAGLWFAFLTEGQRAAFDADTGAGIRHFLSHAGWWPVAATAAWTLILGLATQVQFLRMPMPARRLHYEADAEGLVTRDEAGAQLKIPWSIVREIKPTKHLLLLKLNTRAWRYLPWRAFAPEDRTRLIALARRYSALQTATPAADPGA